MKSFLIEGVTYEIPDFVVEKDEDKYVFVITEGKFSETRFTIDNMQMDEEDEGLLHYDLFWSDNLQKEDVDEFSKMVGKIIINILREQLEESLEST